MGGHHHPFLGLSHYVTYPLGNAPFFVQEWQCAWADGQVQLQGTLPTCEPQVEPTVGGSVDPPRVLLAAASWLNPMKYSIAILYPPIIIGDYLPAKDRVFPDAA